ncbi:MAG: hypothetical protein ACR2P2_10640 [Nakamurella sp.]
MSATTQEATVTTQELGGPVQYSAAVANIAPAAMTASDALADALKSRPTKSAIVEAQLLTADQTPGQAPTHRLNLDLNADAWDTGQSIRAFWEGSLFQGVVAEDLATGSDTATGVSGGTFTLHFSDGTTHQVDAGAGKVRTGQIFAQLDAAGREQAARDSAAIVESFGLVATSVTFVTYRDDALAVVASVPPGGSVKDFELLRQALTGSPVRYEGVYLEVRDSSGAPIAISAGAFRTGNGLLWG